MSVLVGRLSRLTVGCAAAAVLLGAGEAGAQQRRRSNRIDQTHIDTTVAIGRNGTVSVSATSGDVVVVGWSKDGVHIRAESDGGNIRMDASNGSRVSVDIGGGDSHVEVSVPYGVHVVASSHSGDVSVRGTRGAVDARTQSGDLQVEDVVGKLSANTFSGDITANSINGDATVQTISGSVRLTDERGDVEIGTVSGEIELRGMTSKTVRAKTTSGDVTYDGLIDSQGRYEMSTHSGDLRLHVQRDAGAQISVSTWSGEIDSAFPMTLNPGEHGIGSQKAKRFTFSIGSGAARITADTFSGDISISSNGRGANLRR